MPSETDLMNDALSQIGAATITAIDDGTTNANICQTLYPTLRDGLIRAHHWNFAMKRVVLTPDVTPPVSEWAYAYTLPPDSLKVVDYAGGNPSSAFVWIPYEGVRAVAAFKIEDRKLYSNDGTAYIRYLKRVTNPDEWDALFYQALASWLASKLASAITKDAKTALTLLEVAERILSMAMAVDGQEGSIEPYIVDDLLWGR